MTADTCLKVAHYNDIIITDNTSLKQVRYDNIKMTADTCLKVVQDPGVDGNIILKLTSKKWIGEHGLD